MASLFGQGLSFPPRVGAEAPLDAAEVRQVGTATHADMLTGVDELAGGGVLKGAGPSAEPIT